MMRKRGTNSEFLLQYNLVTQRQLMQNT